MKFGCISTVDSFHSWGENLRQRKTLASTKLSSISLICTWLEIMWVRHPWSQNVQLSVIHITSTKGFVRSVVSILLPLVTIAAIHNAGLVSTHVSLYLIVQKEYNIFPRRWWVNQDQVIAAARKSLLPATTVLTITYSPDVLLSVAASLIKARLLS
jgi:hypothetical protein